MMINVLHNNSVSYSNLTSFVRKLVVHRLCPSQQGNGQWDAPRSWALGVLQKKNYIWNKLLEYLPLIGFSGCEVAISIILKFAHKYTCLLEVTFEMWKRNIISKNAEM